MKERIVAIEAVIMSSMDKVCKLRLVLTILLMTGLWAGTALTQDGEMSLIQNKSKYWIGIEAGLLTSDITDRAGCVPCALLAAFQDEYDCHGPSVSFGLVVGKEMSKNGEIELESGLGYRQIRDKVTTLHDLVIPIRLRFDFLPKRSISPTLMFGSFVSYNLNYQTDTRAEWEELKPWDIGGTIGLGARVDLNDKQVLRIWTRLGAGRERLLEYYSSPGGAPGNIDYRAVYWEIGMSYTIHR